MYWSQCRSININDGQWRSISINTSHCFSMPIGIEKHWEILIDIDRHWLALTFIELYFGSIPEIWSVIDQYWSALITDTACPDVCNMLSPHIDNNFIRYTTWSIQNPQKRCPWIWRRTSYFWYSQRVYYSEKHSNLTDNITHTGPPPVTRLLGVLIFFYIFLTFADILS